MHVNVRAFWGRWAWSGSRRRARSWGAGSRLRTASRFRTTPRGTCRPPKRRRTPSRRWRAAGGRRGGPGGEQSSLRRPWHVGASVSLSTRAREKETDGGARTESLINKDSCRSSLMGAPFIHSFIHSFIPGIGNGKKPHACGCKERSFDLSWCVPTHLALALPIKDINQRRETSNSSYFAHANGNGGWNRPSPSRWP